MYSLHHGQVWYMRLCNPAVFLKAKPSEKTGKRVGHQGAYTTRFHDYACAMKSVGIRGHVTHTFGPIRFIACDQV